MSSIGPAAAIWTGVPFTLQVLSSGPRCAVRLDRSSQSGDRAAVYPRHQYRRGHAGDLVSCGDAEHERLSADVVGANDHGVPYLASRRLGPFQHEVLGGDSTELRKRVS